MRPGYRALAERLGSWIDDRDGFAVVAKECALVGRRSGLSRGEIRCLRSPPVPDRLARRRSRRRAVAAHRAHCAAVERCSLLSHPYCRKAQHHLPRARHVDSRRARRDQPLLARLPYRAGPRHRRRAARRAARRSTWSSTAAATSKSSPAIGRRAPTPRCATSTSGVAEHSLHISGRAIDVRLTSAKTTALRDAAIAHEAGGVGYYAESNFVHIDTGAFRSW